MKTVFIFFLIVVSLHTQAKDLGRIGPTFPIGELDMLVWIENRLKGFEASGKLDDMKQEFTEQVKRSIETPAAINLPTTLKPSVFYVDPSLTIPQDLVDPKTGQVFAKAGTRVNPFDIKTWPNGSKLPHFEYSKSLVFLDANDIKQLAWAQKINTTKPIKWILTGGSPNKVAKLLNTRIYFDQQGLLTEQLHIKHVPSLVEQSGIHWKITEFDVSQIEAEMKP